MRVSKDSGSETSLQLGQLIPTRKLMGKWNLISRRLQLLCCVLGLVVTVCLKFRVLDLFLSPYLSHPQRPSSGETWSSSVTLLTFSFVLIVKMKHNNLTLFSIKSIESMIINLCMFFFPLWNPAAEVSASLVLVISPDNWGGLCKDGHPV